MNKMTLSKLVCAFALALSFSVSISAFADNTDEFSRKAHRWDLDKRCDLKIDNEHSVLIIEDRHTRNSQASRFDDCDERSGPEGKTIYCYSAKQTLLTDAQSGAQICQAERISLDFDAPDGRKNSLNYVTAVVKMGKHGKCDPKHALDIIKDAKDVEKRGFNCAEDRNRQ